jgi:hypothetical protein
MGTKAVVTAVVAAVVVAGGVGSYAVVRHHRTQVRQAATWERAHNVPNTQTVGSPEPISASLTARSYDIVVSGRITDRKTGAPIPEANVAGHIVIWGYSPLSREKASLEVDLFENSPHRETRSDSNGRYALSFNTPLTAVGEMKGKDGLCAYATAPGYESRPVYPREHVTPGHTTYEDIDIALEPGELVAGRALDEDGNPIAGALVRLGSYDNGDWNFFGALGRTQTDEHGSFQIQCSTDENLRHYPSLTICKDGYGMAYVWDVLNNGKGGDVVVHRGGTIIGRVTDAAGKGIPNCQVVADSMWQSPPVQTRTDAAGAYELKGVVCTENMSAYFRQRAVTFPGDKDLPLNEFQRCVRVYARPGPGMRYADGPHASVLPLQGQTITAPDLVIP